MPARTVKQWYDAFIDLKLQSSHNAAALVGASMTGDLGHDLDQMANALSAFRMLPITSHEDKQPWYAPLPSATTFLNLVPPADNNQ